MEILENIRLLSQLDGPSGFEAPVAGAAVGLLQKYADSVRVDAMGNVIAEKSCGKKEAKKLLLDAHIDEIGLIVTGVEDGFLKFSPIGGVDPRILPATEVLILAEKPYTGVIATMPPHALSKEDMEKAIKTEELSIDTGLGAQAAELIPLGTPVVFRTGLDELSGGRICGKALDDRACMAIILRALELIREPEIDVAVMFSTQEELGARGAKTGAYAVQPDWCIAVDVTHAKTPDAEKDGLMDMGRGPAIGVGPSMNKCLSDRMLQVARQKDIPYQTEVMAGNTGTNAWTMQTAREGICTGVVSLPLRYMHTPSEFIELKDAENTAMLLAALAESLGKEGL